MSKLGKKTIQLPKEVTLTVIGRELTAKGPKGELQVHLPSNLVVSVADDLVTVAPIDSTNVISREWGLAWAMVKNVIVGVSSGFDKNLEIVGVGYRVQGLGPTKLQFSLGFSHAVIVDAPEGISFEVTDNNKIKVLGNDTAMVGQVAAKIRNLRPPEPYKGKGIRYANEVVLRKAGKSAKAGK